MTVKTDFKTRPGIYKVPCCNGSILLLYDRFGKCQANPYVFTILMLAADNLQEMFLRADVFADIPESGEMLIRADMEWTMEAIMNILKDCMEHTPPGGTVHCSYEQNPLYTQIRIWDTGAGFAKEDIPHLFERFYRGRKMKGDGIGIGLALSKAIIEEQNGTITARNLKISMPSFPPVMNCTLLIILL